MFSAKGKEKKNCLRILAGVGVEMAHRPSLFLASISGKLVGTTCTWVKSEAASLSVTRSAQQSRLLSLQSGSVSLLTFLPSLPLFHQTWIVISWSVHVKGMGKFLYRSAIRWLVKVNCLPKLPWGRFVSGKL